VLDVERNSAGVAAVRERYGLNLQPWSDNQIIKFLIARKFDMPKVYEMIDNNLKWVAEFKPSPDEFFPPEMTAQYPVGYSDNHDRDGNIIYIERAGNAGQSSPNIFMTHGVPLVTRWHVTSSEMGKMRIAASPTATRVTAVVDMSDLGKSDSGVLKFAKAISRVDQDNYPEHLSRMLIINAPGFMTGLWRLFQVFVDARTREKIQILTPEKTKAAMDKYIEPRLQPSFCGGEDESWMKLGGRIGGVDPCFASANCLPAHSAEGLPDDEGDVEDEAAYQAAAMTPQRDQQAASPPSEGSPEMSLKMSASCGSAASS
jgi:hypothetical protein